MTHTIFDTSGPGAFEPRDEVFLRQAMDLAEVAFARGERPFGALIAGPDGAVLSRAHNCSHARDDVTAHAEVTAIRTLREGTVRDTLSRSTLYSSAEPCAMCAGAIYWAGIGRVVYGLSEGRLRALRNVNARTAALTIGCREVLSSGGHQTEVLGPMLEEDAAVPHRSFWARYSV